VNDVLKQRLVGALILVALGVVFWPIIFVEPGERPGLDQVRIPPRPQVDTTPIEPPERAGLRPSETLQAPPVPPVEAPGTEADRAEKPLIPAAGTETASPTAAAVPAPGARTRTEPPEKPELDSDGVPIAWILQVASVSSDSKAEELRQRLQALNHKAYVKKVTREGKSLYRVYVGPKFERARLETIQADIDAQFGVKSMVMRYYP
jgi:DedD protein